jgi:competence/damage-inducible protein CinA-like protein
MHTENGKVVELISIGNELLNGATVDTNSAYIARRLDSIGLDICYKATIGDAVESLSDILSMALRRSDIVIATGGLGPTDDDITKKAICKVFKRNLVFHENILEEIQKRFRVRGIQMPAINQNQALLPQGARFLKNRIGSALGIIIEDQGKIFCALPGVPAEVEIMTDEELIPYLKPFTGSQIIIRHRMRTVGIMESVIAERIRPVLKFAEGVSLAYLPSYRGVDLSIKGIGTVRQEIEAGVKLLADGIRRMIPDYIYTEDDKELEEVIGRLLIDKGYTLAVAESCTGGKLADRITRVPGASRYFTGGVIAYSNDIKINQLGVAPETIETYGAVSEQTAEAMASGIINLLGASMGVAITGVAGPDGGSDEKPVGTVYIGLAVGNRLYSRLFKISSEREVNRQRAVTFALEMIRKEILGLAD